MCDGKAGGALSDFKSGSSDVIPEAANDFSRTRDSWAKLSPVTAACTAEEVLPKFLHLRFPSPGGAFLSGVIQVLLVDFLEQLFQEIEVYHPVLREREEERLWGRTQRLHFAGTENAFSDVHILIWPSAWLVRLLESLTGADSWAKLSPRHSGSHTGGCSPEVLRPRFHQPREHFLDQYDSSFAGRLPERLFQELEVYHPVVREREEDNV